MTSFETITPIDGSVLLKRDRPSDSDVDRALTLACRSFKAWRERPLIDRIESLSRAVDKFVANRSKIASEITNQMGRPVSQSGGEVAGFEARARTMLRLAPEALARVIPSTYPGFDREIDRVPLGTVVVLAPWNYPYLTAVNSIIPALAAGNVVILKHSDQTPLAAERLSVAFEEAGLPAGVFQFLHMNHDQVAKAVADPRVAYVCFTGSVVGGHAVQKALAGTFTNSGLELGGKDPAYVREDANIEHAIENIADGIFFNSGQSCCGIERVYVHETRFNAVVQGLAAFAERLKLGDPRDPSTTLGPMVKASAAAFVRGQIEQAVAQGAKTVVRPEYFTADTGNSAYLAPQILVNCDHSMEIMSEETFGPVAGVLAVRSDEEAIQMMNDSQYGLTASIWTEDQDAAHAIGEQLDTGTVFMNRCDYLDPELPWTGVKDSGRGATLSRIGFDYLTRPKSYHFRLLQKVE